jgi:hypothetical protein
LSISLFPCYDRKQSLFLNSCHRQHQQQAVFEFNPFPRASLILRCLVYYPTCLGAGGTFVPGRWLDERAKVKKKKESHFCGHLRHRRKNVESHLHTTFGTAEKRGSNATITINSKTATAPISTPNTTTTPPDTTNTTFTVKATLRIQHHPSLSPPSFFPPSSNTPPT